MLTSKQSPHPSDDEMLDAYITQDDGSRDSVRLWWDEYNFDMAESSRPMLHASRQHSDDQIGSRETHTTYLSHTTQAEDLSSIRRDARARSTSQEIRGGHPPLQPWREEPEEPWNHLRSVRRRNLNGRNELLSDFRSDMNLKRRRRGN